MVTIDTFVVLGSFLAVFLVGAWLVNRWGHHRIDRIAARQRAGRIGPARAAVSGCLTILFGFIGLALVILLAAEVAGRQL